MPVASTVMAKKRSDRDDIAVKIDRAVASKARLIAAHKGVSIAELISEMVRPAVDKEYARMVRELEKSES